MTFLLKVYSPSFCVSAPHPLYPLSHLSGKKRCFFVGTGTGSTDSHSCPSRALLPLIRSQQPVLVIQIILPICSSIWNVFLTYLIMTLTHYAWSIKVFMVYSSSLLCEPSVREIGFILFCLLNKLCKVTNLFITVCRHMYHRNNQRYDVR